MKGAPRKTSTESLLAGARELFAGRGVAATAVSDITRAAGIAKGTFYRYFESKEALVDALFIPDALALSALLAGDGSRPRVADMARALLSFFGDRPLFLSELVVAWRSRAGYRFVDIARACFSPLMRAYFKADPRFKVRDPEAYSELIVGAVLELCAWRAVAGRIADEGEAMAMLQDLLKRFFDCES